MVVFKMYKNKSIKTIEHDVIEELSLEDFNDNMTEFLMK